MLYDAGVGNKTEDDTEDFITIFKSRSYPQLQETFEEYQRLAGRPIEDAIGNEFEGEMRKGLLAIGKDARLYVGPNGRFSYTYFLKYNLKHKNNHDLYIINRI